MRFRLLEKFSKSIPKEIKSYISSSTSLINYITHGLNIDLANASCGVATDPEKIHSALESVNEQTFHARNSLNIIIFVVLKSGEIIAYPYEHQVFSDPKNNYKEHIIDFCLFNPEKVSRAYAIYNASDEATKAFEDKLRFRNKVNADKNLMYHQGELRNGDYPIDVDRFPALPDYDTDKSGYAINPEKLTKKLNRYRAENYSNYLSNIYKRLTKYEKIIRDATTDFDILDDKASQDISEYYRVLSNAVKRYNSTVRSLETMEQHVKDPLKFKSALQNFFENDYVVYELDDLLSELKELTSKIEYVDFNW